VGTPAERAQGSDAVPSDRALYAGYFALQAAGGVVLWAAIASSNTVRSWFELRADLPQVTDGFFFPDMVVVSTSALAAWVVWTHQRAGTVLAGVALGGILYPTAYLFSWVTASSGDGWIALAVMLAVSALCAWATLGVYRLQRADDRAVLDATDR
jgi:hypothetical protein